MKPLLAALLALGLWPAAAGATPPLPPSACEAPPQPPERTAEQRRRHREVWSDSLWLVKQVRARYADRLAGVHVDTADPARTRLVIRVTGHEPLPPMRLGDRARDVPVVVEYGAPHSLDDVAAIRGRVAPQVRALLPGLQGEGYDEAAGAIHLDVHAPDGTSATAALARCEALQALYGMSVHIHPNAGVLALE